MTRSRRAPRATRSPRGSPPSDPAVLFADERTRDRAEIATYLRTVADNLDRGAPITPAAGDRSVTVEPPTRPTFGVERETSTGGDERELSVELAVEWDEASAGEPSGTLGIE